MVMITMLGNAGWVWIVLSIVMIAVKKTRKCGLQMMLALILMLVIGNIFLKQIFARERPCIIDSTVALLIPIPIGYSFPSGHSFSSAAASITLFLYYKKAGICAMVLAALIAFSRMYLFVHFPSDVIGGILLGMLVARIASKWMPSLEAAWLHSRKSKKEHNLLKKRADKQ